MNPVILLSGGTSAAANGTPAWSLNQNYADNIRRAGGHPLLAVNNDCAENMPIWQTVFCFPAEKTWPPPLRRRAEIRFCYYGSIKG